MGIRARLTLAFIALTFLALMVINFTLLNMLERYYINYEDGSLRRSGQLATDLMMTHLKEQTDPVTLSALAENFSRQVNARVVILNSEGVVIGDSVRIGGLLGNPLNRPEIRSALGGQSGRSVQYSEFSQQWVLQLALPVQDNGKILGAVFLSASLRHVYDTLEAVRRFLILSTMVVILLVGTTGLFIAEHLIKPLKALTKAAHKISEGELEQQIEVASRDEIGRLAGQFNLMASRLAAMNQRQRRFVSDVSHELRTPLTSLSLCIKSLQDYPMEKEEEQEFLGDMEQEIQRLANLVEDLLALTRSEEKLSKREMVPIKPLLEEVIAKNTDRARRQKIELFCQLPEEMPVLSIAGEEIKRVLYNLLDNALKYTPAGGWVQVEAQLEKESNRVRVSVKDTGCGIPPEALPYIFERFYRVDKARSRDLGGTGLGLSISQEIIEKHGGTLEAASVLDEGTIISFTLPIPPEAG